MSQGEQQETAPTGEPKINPLTPEHYAALNMVMSRAEMLDDAIARAAHAFGLDMSPQRAAHEMHKGVAARTLHFYPQPKKNVVEL